MPRFATCLTSAFVLMGTTTVADITAADVWANHQAYYAATGATVTGTPQVEGASTLIEDAIAVFTLPFGVGSISVSLPPLHMTDNPDGTVTFEDAGPFTVDVAADIENTRVALSVSIDHDSTSGSASGTAGDITYVYEAGAFRIGLQDFQLSEDGIDLQLKGIGEGYRITSRVVEGELVTTTSNVTVLPLTLEYSLTTSDGISATSTATYGTSQTSSVISLLAGGATLIDLTSALRAGMSVAMETATQSNVSDVTMMLDSTLVSQQTTEVGPSDAALSLSAAGLALSADARDVLVSINQPDVLPFPLSFEASALDGGYVFPVLADTAPQDFAFDLKLKGLRLSHGIWALFDPNKGLPRDPMTVGFDIDGIVINPVNVFSAEEVRALVDTPVDLNILQSVTVQDLVVEAIGSRLTGGADMTFDNTDYDTFNGLPKPVGQANLSIEGAFALLDRLVIAGAVSGDMGRDARMGIGLLATQTGDDSYEALVEFTKEGALHVNGLQVR